MFVPDHNLGRVWPENKVLRGDGGERRRDPRLPAAFAFWLAKRPPAAPSSGWMMNVSTGGAAFLCQADRTPQVGDELELHEMHVLDPHVRQAGAELPRTARVLRVEPGQGSTRRVAVRFETSVSASLSPVREGAAATACRSAAGQPVVHIGQPPWSAPAPKAELLRC